MSRLFLLFLITPIVELYLLIQLGQIIGIGPTLAVILTTAVIGSTMARREGLGAWMRFQQALSAGRLPGVEMIDGIIILVSGAFLLTPGVLTDLIGFLGIFPVTRKMIRGLVTRRLRESVKEGRINIRFSGPFGAPFTPDGPADVHNGAAPSEDPARAKSGKYDTTFGGAAKERPSHGADPPGTD